MTEVSCFVPPASEWEPMRNFDTPKAAANFVKREEGHNPELYGAHVPLQRKHYLMVDTA